MEWTKIGRCENCYKIVPVRSCGVVCIVMREDTHVNILPSPKGLVLEMEHERSGWTGCSRSWPVALLPEDCWECCSSLGPAR
jgi:hypothetical protein